MTQAIPTTLPAPPPTNPSPWPYLQAPGIGAWVWPLDKHCDWPAIVAGAVEYGITSLIPQAGIYAPTWLTTSRLALAASAGVQVTAGLGLDGQNGFESPAAEQVLTHAIIDCLHDTHAACLNWESAWAGLVDKYRATRVLTAVKKAVDDAWERLWDAPWWAPRYTLDSQGKQHPTHPSAPTTEFDPACRTGGRWVQAYGRNGEAPVDGKSTRMLAWARDASQYPHLGTPADQIMPAHQGYNGSLTDQVNTMIREPSVMLWVFKSFDAECKLALRVVKKLRELGFDGPTAVRMFQLHAGLMSDGIVGAKTVATLGLERYWTAGLLVRRPA